jgi:hypothetical protein
LNTVLSKFKEVIFSVLPIIVLVLILSFTITPISSFALVSFLIGAGLVMLGLILFLFGVEIGIAPLGSLLGSSLAKKNVVWIVLVSVLVLGFFVSIAEPDLLVFAKQVDKVTAGQISSYSILIVVSIGLSIMLAFGFFRVLYNIPLYKVLFVLYLLLFGLAFFSSPEFLAISLDASGSTTGILAVPFILSLSVGISMLKKDSKASEKDSFGLVAIASVGAVMSVMILGLLKGSSNFAGSLSSKVLQSETIVGVFTSILPEYCKESIVAIVPLIGILLFIQTTSFRLRKSQFRKLLTGFVFAFVGLLLFLVGVNAGFMEVGATIGKTLALLPHKSVIVFIGFIIGFVTIMAEPAVYVLTHQIEAVTSGYVKRKAVLIFLAIGVGFAVMLSVLRIIIPQIQLWHYLLPGYILCLVLMFFAPKLFVGIAFDAGGVATGPITVTFILAFIQGAANAFEGSNLLVDGFGMIAMVAMIPIITLQVLGVIFRIKSRTKEEVV